MPPQPARASRTPYVIAGIIGSALVVSALIVSVALRNFGESLDQSARRLDPANIARTALPQSTPTFIVRPPVINQIRALADLTTVSSTMSTVVEASKPRVGNVVSERLLLVACGRVKAGVDLSKMRAEDVVASPDGKRVRIRLPKAELQDVYLIDDSTQPCTTRVYDRTNLLVLAETKELESQAREQAVNAVRDMALQTGVLKEADKNARIAIDRVLGAAGFDTVEFIDP